MTVTFMNAWNNYLWPTIILQDKNQITMPMLVANLKSGYSVDYGMLMPVSYTHLDVYKRQASMSVRVQRPVPSRCAAFPKTRALPDYVSVTRLFPRNLSAMVCP